MIKLTEYTRFKDIDPSQKPKTCLYCGSKSICNLWKDPHTVACNEWTDGGDNKERRHIWIKSTDINYITVCKDGQGEEYTLVSGLRTCGWDKIAVAETPEEVLSIIDNEVFPKCYRGDVLIAEDKIRQLQALLKRALKYVKYIQTDEDYYTQHDIKESKTLLDEIELTLKEKK